MRPQDIERVRERLHLIACDALATCDWDRRNRDGRIDPDPTASYVRGSDHEGVYLGSLKIMVDVQAAAFSAVMRENEKADPAFARDVDAMIDHLMRKDIIDEGGGSGRSHMEKAWSGMRDDAMHRARCTLEREGVPPHLQDPDRRRDVNVPLTSRVDKPAFNISKAVMAARDQLGILERDALGVGEQAAVARLLHVHAPAAHIMRDRLDETIDGTSPGGGRLAALRRDAREHMTAGDFSQPRHDARIARRVAAWSAPSLSASTRELLGVGMSQRDSTISRLFDEVAVQVEERNKTQIRRMDAAGWVAAMSQRRME